MKSKLLNNIFHLTILQGSTYILPLIVFPYLVRTLGTEKYGLFIFCQVIVQYLTLISDFGFNFSSTQEIARNQEDKTKITKIFWTTIWAKFFLMIVAIFIFWVLGFFINEIRSVFFIIIMFSPQILGGIILPVWLFQGKEEMKIISISSLISRIASIIFIFILVKGPGDIYVAALMQSSISLLTAMLVLIYSFNKKWVGHIYFCLQDTVILIKDSVAFFISVLSVNLYTSLPTLIVGVVLGTESVAYYNIANTVRNAMQGLFNPISQSLFPRINSLYVSNYYDAKKLIMKSIKIVAIIFSLMSVSVFVLSPYIIYIITGYENEVIIIILRCLCIIPFVSAVCNILGVQTMITHGFKKQFSLLTLFWGVFNLIIIFPLIHWFGVLGSAWSVLITETLVLLSFYIFLKMKKIF
ncbi:flippase [Affinibrenneria salicis]|uniref:Flippase n=1 Tax=Affinibrenneria salicis TaxID=2590031 RepID=A0A5J5FZS1_9GAMM|nr:flippase [Affinibrenneria salicis]KAA8999850.1 flippase [Affinibrenneria salicis]